MAKLTPILRPGATHRSELLLVTARDFIGVQTNFEDPNRGINRQTEWTRDVVEWSDEEHDRNGVHDTVKIPRAVVLMGYIYGGNGGVLPVADRYDILGSSYLMGRYKSQLPGLFSISVVGSGIIDVKLAIPMPSADFGVIDLCQVEAAGAGWRNIWVHGQALSADVVRITRRCSDPSPTDGYHGPMAFALVG